MAFTDAFRVVVGAPTKKSDADTIATNTEWLRGASDQDHDFDISTGTGDHNVRVGSPMHMQVVTTGGTAQTWSMGWWQSTVGSWWLLVSTGDYTSFNSTGAAFYLRAGDIRDVPNA